MLDLVSFLKWLGHRRGCTFGQRFVRLLILTGPPWVVLEVLGSGVRKEPNLLPWFLVLAIPVDEYHVCSGNPAKGIDALWLCNRARSGYPLGRVPQNATK
jgi:hypothetical protein